ncbi:Bug family tripartite tricarboxylate transporter substrate binding protein [Spiribacter halobius]|uniref:Transporter n=1 Tax=Sediminicurvatus halobius TaxID=2182432 RepID=A0A2U2N9E1_9GAMM|nr:tripartite tricarboxylate transporter substrate binding protein [Spiribacter halobius]PWG65825.1 transporter [Spiribacter halobius]UEX77869.1 tripartite tricarboxylate transporter substrate binding protein [Spiribacter halobius]
MIHSPNVTHRAALGAVAAAAMLAAPLTASAQDCSAEEWPCDTIEVVSHASAGGGTDTTIRMWLDAARETIDEEMRVVYKQGGGARAAHEYMMSRGPDGHTIMALTQTHLYTIARGNSPIKEMDQIQGVARAMDDPSVIVVNPDSPYDTYEEFLEASEDQALTWGVAQVGGTEHIGISRWAEQSGAKTRVVPFGSGGEMITSLRSGAVDASLANISEALAQIEEGDLKPIAVLYHDRVGDLPDTPSTYEHGHEVSVTTTRGYYVHGETDPEIVERIEQLILAGMDSERFKDYLRSSGLDPETNVAGADVWDKQIKEEYQVSLEALRKLDMTDR